MTNEETDSGQRLELSLEAKRRTPCLRSLAAQTAGEEKLAVPNKMQAIAALQPPRDRRRPHPLLLPNSADPITSGDWGLLKG